MALEVSVEFWTTPNVHNDLMADMNDESQTTLCVWFHRV